MLTPSEIKTFIDNDKASARKRHAREGLRYYEGDHDIRDYRMFFINADGKIVEDTTKSNIKISHPFFTELVDQEVQYTLSSKDGFVKSDDPELQNKLDAYFNNNDAFLAELSDILTGAVAKGFEYAYAYKDSGGRTAFKCADSLCVVEVSGKDASDGNEYVIYYYTHFIGSGNKKITHIQVWDESQTYYFCQVDDGAIVEDKTVEYNPRPHTIWEREGDEAVYCESFGFIPFFRIDNCGKQFSGLKPIKALIDDYDLMSCGLSNNIQDTNEALYVVKGFQGDNLDDLMQNIRTKKHIGVDDDGGVDIKTIEIPFDARKTKLEIDEKNIYRFGMGFNSAQIGDGNITNIVIKSRYALLDLKCNKLEAQLKQFMRKLIKGVLDEINAATGTGYQMKDIYFDFKREIMTNAADNAQIALTDAQRRQTEINTILNLAGTLDDDTALKLICEQLDVDYQEVKGKAPNSEDDLTAAAQAALEAVKPDGDVIE